MGLINNDSYTYPTIGTDISNTYINVAKNAIRIVRVNDNDSAQYRIQYSYSIWYTQEHSLTENAKPFETKPGVFLTDEDTIKSNDIYSLVYAQIKLIYTNTSDV